MMQQINTGEKEDEETIRLARQLPANIIKKKTSPIQQKYVNNKTELTVKNLQTDLDEFDTQRSLSTCPTYASLSRNSPETRECGTQITTLTPTETVDNNQELSRRSPLYIDEQPFEGYELMPVSSGFVDYPYNYPNRTNHTVRPQIVTRAETQFRNNQRDKNQNGFNGNYKSKSNGRLPPVRPTAVKESPRSDPYSTAKRNDINSKTTKNNSVPNGFRHVPPRESHQRVNSPSPGRKNGNGNSNGNRPAQKYNSSASLDQDNYDRRSKRYPNKTNNSDYHPSTPPPPPLPREDSDRPRRMRVASNDYVIQRRRKPPPEPEYVYEEYRTESPIETRRRRPSRVVRVLRDPPYRDDDDVYYVEPSSTRRKQIVRRSPPTEYIYADASPPPPPPPPETHRRRPRRQEVVYVDEERPVEYEEEVVYVDEDGNEIEYVDERGRSPEYVEYVYEDEKDRRRSRNKSKVIYVEDDSPVTNGRHRSKSKQPSSTRIVYE